MSANTTNRAYTYPQSTDDFRPYEDIQELATDVDTDITAIIATYLTPVTVSGASVGTVSTNFTVSSAVVRTLANGKDVYLKLEIVSTNAITATSGNIADTQIFLLTAAYWPTELTPTIFSANAGTGYVDIQPDGRVTIRTSDVSIAAGGTMRMAFKYIRT